MFTPSTTSSGAPATAPTTGGFSFGGKPGGGFSFGAPATSSSAAGGFGFGAPATTSSTATGPGFGAPATTSSAASGFGFGAPATTSSTTTGLGFGTAAAAVSKPGFSFGTPTTSATPASTTSTTGFGTLPVGKPGASGFGFGLSSSTSGSSAPAATLQPPSTVSQPTASGLLMKSAAPGTSTSTTTPGLALGSSLSAGAVSKPSSTALGSQLGASLSMPAAASAAATNATTATVKGFAAPTTTAAAPGGATATTSTSSASTGPKMTYKELEEQMNKWWVELEHQEKLFLEQATKVNAWDKVLIKNGQEITTLNSDVSKVKLDQHRLNHELDFIVAQQKELEEMLAPLEESVSKLPPINFQQHTDSEREHTYQIAEQIDAQLKRMTEDLKEVIDHLNTSTGSQDKTDPMLQISKILNAHMESLQWVDQNAAVLQRKTEEVARYADYTKKEHERNFRLAYS